MAARQVNDNPVAGEPGGSVGQAVQMAAQEIPRRLDGEEGHLTGQADQVVEIILRSRDRIAELPPRDVVMQDEIALAGLVVIAKRRQPG